MNISATGANSFGRESTKTIFAGNLMMQRSNGLKSTQEKLERQQKAGNEIAFFENQKANLKNMECDTVEDIVRKLDMFHSYEDQIAAAKAAYNNEQMFHIMDEAKERGEKIAEAAEDMEPKTPEERREEAREEALGVDESEGMPGEMPEEATDVLEESAEMQKELQEAAEEITEETTEDSLEKLAEQSGDAEQMEMERSAEKEAQADRRRMEQEAARRYRPFDLRA